MEIEFPVTTESSLSFVEEYFKKTDWYRKQRNQFRFRLPAFLLLFAIVWWFISGVWVPPVCAFVVLSGIWIIASHAIFDARVHNQALELLAAQENRGIGTYKLQINETGLKSVGPVGEQQYDWASVDHVVLNEDFLHIYCSGPFGFPVPLNVVGEDVGKRTYQEIERLRHSSK